MGPRARLP